jgi:hypothetical protein
VNLVDPSMASQGKRGDRWEGGYTPITMERVCKCLKRMEMSWRHRGKECGTDEKKRRYRKCRSFASKRDSTVLAGSAGMEFGVHGRG